MDIRAQVSMVFHLDKCIGCHTCSIACKNIWTDRKGTEYMWWNNVETKPGTGYPTRWEDQERYKGGFEEKDGKLRLKLQGRLGALGNIFFNPNLPNMDDYYEPWTYDYQHLFDAPDGDDQPTARAISLVTGKPIDTIEAGPNWDDDLGGSPVYAENDKNLDELTQEEREQLNEVERMTFFYLPRICNHCLNPGCVAACPAGAIYKRGEDGIVLLSQEKCRAWRMCISGCPYKKTYFNWSTGKSEKCILCYPRIESGQPPACFHSCVGRIRYLGVLLYDADQIEKIASAAESSLVDAQRSMIMDPFDPTVIAAAKANGIPDNMIDSAQKSPVYKFVKQWGIALPLHAEFRTVPMLFYVPPMLPVLAKTKDGNYEVDQSGADGLSPLLSALEKARVPIKFMARLFSAGNTDVIEAVYRKLIAVRIHRRSETVKDVSPAELDKAYTTGGTDPQEADAIFRLTALPTYDERFVVPAMNREVAIEANIPPLTNKQETGFGFRRQPGRRF
ncbi:MAG: nitrate reductase subunit beta [Anaerolineae bacterium]|uniref:nitrate reductase subunit beta n=1 Tax=Candidatus Amarolinea dominans TaxID=3140696 RepID=UPI001D411094|nr:nitrate reductase subunit beta [Anaerolineae bacterium]MBK7199545.1 nitrate reductase subunit beta [Anaerolineae bacterium]MBK9231769.1 nitrate reductase subunit beta [Anaerolineae bacterium]